MPLILEKVLNPKSFTFYGMDDYLELIMHKIDDSLNVIVRTEESHLTIIFHFLVKLSYINLLESI